MVLESSICFDKKSSYLSGSIILFWACFINIARIWRGLCWWSHWWLRVRRRLYPSSSTSEPSEPETLLFYPVSGPRLQTQQHNNKNIWHIPAQFARVNLTRIYNNIALLMSDETIIHLVSDCEIWSFKFWIEFWNLLIPI